MDEKIAELKKLVDSSNRIVFFGGAGVSTESGIPDFRSEDGLYHQKFKYPPEMMLSHSFYVGHKKEFYEFYREKMLCLDAKPNIVHKRLAELEAEGRLIAVVTQNIDGLHQKAGSKKVYELHGSVLRNYCSKCGKFYPVASVLKDWDKDMESLDSLSESLKEYDEPGKRSYLEDGVPRCECGGVIKPDVVLYEEGLDDETVSGAVNAIASADLLIIGGTSLNVYPAAGLINYFRGGKSRLVLVNKSATPFDRSAGIVINDSLGKVFSQI